MKNISIKFLLVLLLVVSLISVGYAAFTIDLNIENISAMFRLQTDIRITNFTLDSKSEDAYSNYEEYNVEEVITEVKIPNNDSYVRYKIDITNLGASKMVISKISGLPDNLTYSLDNYELNHLICDENDKCNLGITKSIYLTIRQKNTLIEEDNNEYDLNISFEFSELSYTLNYILKKGDLELVEDLYNQNDNITLNDGVYTIDKNSNYAGLYIPHEYLEDGKTYILNFKIKKISGTLQNIGGHAENAVQKSFTIDGVQSLYDYHQPKQNLFNDMDEHIIEYKFTYDGDAENPGQENKNIHIQPNRKGGTALPVVVDIYDVILYQVYQEKTYKYDENVTISYGPKNPGYVLTEWNTKSDGSGDAYNKGFNIVNLATVNKMQINLFPKWEIKSYTGVPIYDMVEEFAVPGNISSKYVTNSSGIDFSQAASDTNGKGVYIYTGTENDTYPTYYYRGMVENNNVIFANKCWKIVRTTETGGTKLFYNGVPTNGTCNNTGLNSQIANKIKYNILGTLEVAGYSYGKSYKLNTVTLANISNGVIFGNDVTYVDGKYKFINNDENDIYIKDDNMSTELENILKTHHYTCLNTTDEGCSTVYFVYMVRGTAINYVALESGEMIEDVLNNALTNSANNNSSTIKTYIDDWYSSNMEAYTKYLEDTIWCNDRSIAKAVGWTKDGEVQDNEVYKINFSGYKRINEDKKPSLECVNPNDRFTVSATNGNGALTYPIALLTLDEAALAGYVWFVDSGNNYLNNGNVWWLMTPTLVSIANAYVGVAYSILDNVHVAYTSGTTGGVRPSVSLKYGVTIKEGNGTIDNPYIIDDNEYVSITEIYDQNNEMEEKLHIGDFVNYDAGKWSKNEIDSIKVGPIASLVSPNNSLDLPREGYQFGGFTVGTSRNSTTIAAQFNSLGEVKYINSVETNQPIYGWRVFDINETTQEVTLISAGNPEAFYQTNASDAGYSTPYIFSGTIHSSWGESNAANYQQRNWNHYVNEKQNATSAYILSKANLETWYQKYVGMSGDLWNATNFQKIYQYPRLHNIIDNYSFWWLSSTRAAAGPHFVQGDIERRLRGGNDVTLGIRINVILSKDAKFSKDRVGTIELTSEHLDDYGGNQVYNIWDLKTTS